MVLVGNLRSPIRSGPEIIQVFQWFLFPLCSKMGFWGAVFGGVPGGPGITRVPSDSPTPPASPLPRLGTPGYPRILPLDTHRIPPQKPAENPSLRALFRIPPRLPLGVPAGFARVHPQRRRRSRHSVCYARGLATWYTLQETDLWLRNRAEHAFIYPGVGSWGGSLGETAGATGNVIRGGVPPAGM